MQEKVEKARAARLEREKILAQFERDRGDIRRLFMDAVKKLQDVSGKNAIDVSHVKVLPDVNMISFATQLEELGMTSAEALAEVATWMRKYAQMIVSNNQSKIVHIEEYAEVWYSRNDPQQRYPRKSKRLALD